jgi:hypothetical protein
MVWLDVEDYEENYEVNQNGFVRNKKTGKILKYGLNPNGYPMVSLWKNNKGKTKSIHRIVSETFMPIDFDKKEVNHIDGNKENNHVLNLEWSNRSLNIQHAYDNNLRKKGEKHHWSSIDNNDKLLIELMLKYCNIQCKDIALLCNTSKSTVSRIKNK